MYATKNFRTKKALKEAVNDWQNASKSLTTQTPPAARQFSLGKRVVECYQPGPFGPSVGDGDHTCEGPHDDHQWYARVRVSAGRIIKVLA